MLGNYYHQNEADEYKRKMKKLRQTIKELIYENAALCDQVAQIQENILCVKEERRFLLRKLIEVDAEADLLQGNASSVTPTPSISVSTSTAPVSTPGSLSLQSSSTISTSDTQNLQLQTQHQQLNNGQQNLNNKKLIKRRSNNESSNEKNRTVVKKIQRIVQPPTLVPSPVVTCNTQMPLLTTIGVINIPKKQIIQSINLDETGQPIYPISLGSLVLHILGEIVYDRKEFHNETNIYPAGFVTTRIYGHLRDPDKKCVYTCKIIDDGYAPRFEIIPDNDNDLAIVGKSPDICHQHLLQCINTSANIRNIDIRPNGHWFFGLSHPTIISVIKTQIQFIKNLKNFTNFNTNLNNSNIADLDNDPSLNYEALQRHIAISSYHTVPEIKEEPPDELLDGSDSNAFSLN